MTFFTKSDIEIKFWGDCQLINRKSADCYKIEQCPYMREGEGSILGTHELQKLLKIDIFVSFCDDSAHKRAGKQKFSGLLRIIRYVWVKNKIGNFFFKTGRDRAMFWFTLRSVISFKAPTNLP